MKTSVVNRLGYWGLVLTIGCGLWVGPVSAQTPEPAAAPTFELNDHRLKLPSSIVFDSGSATIKPENEAALLHIKAYLDAKPYITTVRIEGHTCCGGDSMDSQQLSEKRALAVAAWLVSRGVDCKRLLAVGFGSTKPVADSTSPEGRASNTRIEVVNAALKDRPIGGMPTDGGGKVAGDVCAP